MSPLPPPEPPDQPAYPLDYASPESNRPVDGVGFGGQVTLGFVAFVGTVACGLVMAAVIGSVTNGAYGIFLAGPAIAAAALLLLSINVYRRRRWTGFLIGALGGLGLLLLALGLCFAVVFR